MFSKILMATDLAEASGKVICTPGALRGPGTREGVAARQTLCRACSGLDACSAAVERNCICSE